MFDGLADMINGSVQANEQYTRLAADDQKAMKFVWLTAKEGTMSQAPAAGMGKTTRDDLMKFVTPQAKVAYDDKSNFAFDKEFFFLYNKGLDKKVIAEIDNALTEIYNEGKIQETQKKSFFIPNFRPSAEAGAYIKSKNDMMKKIINEMK